jgi:hypothetical protein
MLAFGGANIYSIDVTTHEDCFGNIHWLRCLDRSLANWKCAAEEYRDSPARSIRANSKRSGAFLTDCAQRCLLACGRVFGASNLPDNFFSPSDCVGVRALGDGRFGAAEHLSFDAALVSHHFSWPGFSGNTGRSSVRAETRMWATR